MHLITKNISCDSEINNIFIDFHKTTPGPFGKLPPELIFEIFSYVASEIATLGTIRCLNNKWNQLASIPAIETMWKRAFYRDIAFGSDKWVKSFGIGVLSDEDYEQAFTSLPMDDYIADYKKFQSVYSAENVKVDLMLVWLPKSLNGGLTIKNLGELVNPYFPRTIYGYQSFSWQVFHTLKDRTISESHWVLMTKHILPGSRDKSYNDQVKIFAKLDKNGLHNYEVAEALEATACIYAHYFSTLKCLFDEWSYTRLKEEIAGFEVVAGGFTSPSAYIGQSGGLCITQNKNDQHKNGPHEDVGMAAMRRFTKSKNTEFRLQKIVW